MRRREFITLLGGAAVAWPFAARAQQPGERVRRIGILMGTAESDPEAQSWLSAFVQNLQNLGWVEGQDIRIDFRFGAGDGKRLRTYAAELIGLAPEVILGETTQVLSALRESTRTLPIVFVNVADPVSAGFVSSLSRPGGNITGFAGFEYATSGKWLELLKEIAPDVTRVAVVFHDRQAPNSAGRLPTIETLSRSLKVDLNMADVRNEAEIARVVEVLAREPNGGMMVLPSSFTVVHRNLFIVLAAKHRLPAVYPFRYFADTGGLISYGIDTADLYRRAASYVDRILRGARPADLPVQQPTKYELVINLRTARALGLEVPPTLLARADEVIE